jgi:hypothetical protein
MSNDVRDIFKKINELSVEDDNKIDLYDSFDIELSESFVIETGIVGFMEDGVIIEADESMLEFLDFNGVLLESEELGEGYGDFDEELEDMSDRELMHQARMVGLGKYIKQNPADKLELENRQEIIKLLQQIRYDEELDEAEYQGRKVPLGKPMQGDVAKFKVYVKKPNGKVVKVNFGDKNMRIKKSNPARRKSFRARHRCDNPGPRWKARFWSCRAW